ncbi:hypothetical protein FNJ88_06275 [Chryseobacterium sp. SNU WT5]|uniref:hypothetical protein n=1 Tax=Chryseobacterium sp. SNU WT5 TaxID=2594269 RepID=UPI00117F872C|nr:hypothetical protein [Chryseobacterium sp. SNU WT5]QDP85188.1 hypothetical protein FNJ88_06275 [Chryseobacterium sp. SNU WT5]
MQNTNKTQQGQNFIDMVCQLTGTFEEVLEMAILNNRSITTPLEIDTEIKGSVVRNQAIANLFANKQPATALQNNLEEPIEELEGIGYWIINKNFIVQ